MLMQVFVQQLVGLYFSTFPRQRVPYDFHHLVVVSKGAILEV